MAGILKIGTVHIKETDSFLHAIQDDDGTRIVASAPYTWGWFVEQLAGGAVGWLAGTLLSSLFPSGTNVGAAIAAAVKELEGFIREILEQQVIDECVASTDAAWRGLLEYQDTPKARPQRLADALDATNKVISWLEPKQIAAMGPYMHAVSIRTTALFAEAIRIGEPKAWPAAVRMLDAPIKNVPEWCATLTAASKQRITSVSDIQSRMESEGEPPHIHRFFIYYFTWTGGTKEFGDEASARNGRAEVVASCKRDLDVLQRTLTGPALATVEIWKQTRAVAQAHADGHSPVDLGELVVKIPSISIF